MLPKAIIATIFYQQEEQLWGIVPRQLQNNQILQKFEEELATQKGRVSIFSQG